jgi:peptide/nickel transport system substrate-binding protein
MAVVNRPVRFLFLAAVFGLFACGGHEHKAPATATVAEDETKPSDGGTVIRRLPADVASLNPLLSASKYDRWVFFYLYTPLTHFDANLQVIPGLAKSWEISPDGKVYTFHIEPKATFDDGTPVLASDVIWSLKKITDPTSEAVQLAGHFDNVDWTQTKAVDAKTAIIAFKLAFAPQLSFFNDLLVLPEHVYSQGNWKTDYNFKAVGDGPYKLVRRVSGKEILLERRDDFWGAKGHPQYVLFKVINDDATAWQAVMRGDIDETTVTSDTWMTERNRPDLQRILEFHRFYPLQYNYIPWNLRDPLVGDKRLRHALAMCIDVRSIIDNIYRGTARAVIGHFTPDMWAYNPEVQLIPYDPAGAQKELNSLGWLDTNGDGILDKGGKPLRIEMLVSSGSGTSMLFSQLYQSDLKRIGVDLVITPLDGTTMIKRLLAGNYQAGYLSWDLDPDPDPFQILHSSQIPPTGQNFVFYKSAEADKLMEAGRATIDQKKRIEIYHRLQQVLADDQPYAWTVQVSTKWAVNRRVHGVKESSGWGLYNWYPGELDWWIPARYRKNDAAPPAPAPANTTPPPPAKKN